MIDRVTEAVPPLGFARYRALFATAHVRRLVLSGMLARLPAGMIGLALLLLVRENGGGYAAAGAVSGGYFVATAVGAPIAGRLVDRRGQSRILLSRAVIFPTLLAGVCALALLDAPLVLTGAAAAAAGALMPPVGASLRALWPRSVRRCRASCGGVRARGVPPGDHVHRRAAVRRAADGGGLAGLALGAAASGGAGTLLIALAEPVRAWQPEQERHAASILGRSSHAAS